MGGAYLVETQHRIDCAFQSMPLKVNNDRNRVLSRVGVCRGRGVSVSSICWWRSTSVMQLALGDEKRVQGLDMCRDR
jgi:hypothetical protein